MKAFSSALVRAFRLGAMPIVAATLVCTAQLTVPEHAIAKTRPPVELGDPDDTGNEGPVPGPRGNAKVTSAMILPASASRLRPSQVSVSQALSMFVTLWRANLYR